MSIVSGHVPMSAAGDNPNFDALPAELKGIAVSQGHLLPTYSYNALHEVLDAFDVIHNDGKTPLYNWDFIDIIKKAEDAFNPSPLAAAKARIPGIQDYEIDTFIPRSHLITIYRSYQRWLMGLKSLDEALTARWAVYFLQTAMEKLMIEKIALKGVWGGVRTATQADRGADKSFKGMLSVLAEGAGVGGDIPAANIFEGDDTGLDIDNAYAQVQETCQLAYSSIDLKNIPMNVYLAPELFTLYNQARHKKAPESVKLGEMVTQPDYMPNLTFKPQTGLTGKEKIIITPFSNFKFSVNESPTNYNSEIHPVMKGYQLNLLASGGVDYGFGGAIFMNDLD